jgi:hypothetical protein
MEQEVMYFCHIGWNSNVSLVFEPVNGGKANLTETGVNDARAATLKYSQPVIEQKIPWVRIDVSRIHCNILMLTNVLGNDIWKP